MQLSIVSYILNFSTLSLHQHLPCWTRGGDFMSAQPFSPWSAQWISGTDYCTCSNLHVTFMIMMASK